MQQANSIAQFFEILKRYKNYSEIFYRGQSSQYESITSSITRDSGYLANEHIIYSESIGMKEDEFQLLKSPFERLSKLQHYGIPTRLIDVTLDPLVALFFAVQNTNSEYAGLVYVYIQSSRAMTSKHVRLLALLATLRDYDFSTIQQAYQSEYDEFISKTEVLTMAQEITFVEYSEELKRSNIRLYNQKGTFALCGNEIYDGVIQRKLKSLDSIKPALIIRIPYEYKMSVKRELDEQFAINELKIYPELPSVADYIKEKYKSVKFSIDGTYSIMEEQDISTRRAKRISLTIVLKKLLNIDQIQQVSKNIIKQYESKYDVVWIYIANDGDSYIMRNWILRGQWISPNLDEEFRPVPISAPDSEGYYWAKGEEYSTLADYYANHVFDDDKYLYIYYEKIFEEIRLISGQLFSIFQKNYDEFEVELYKKIEEIKYGFQMFSEFGRSRNKEFDDFLYNYIEAASSLDNIHHWVNRGDLNHKQKYYQISLCFRDVHKYIEIIDGGNKVWSTKLGVTQSDYERIDPYNRPEHKHQYEQTIQINPNALEIEFDVQILINPDKTFKITGETNLFDKANLIVSVKKKTGQLHGQGNSEVVDGKFDFGIFSNKGKGYEAGHYIAEISLSIPAVQPEEFIQKSGVEYENLTGPYVDRTGIGPTLRYWLDFVIEQ
ncbi:FRG domain-containing protein [Paenibacillus sp. 32O-W]|uniref:FRG domain-containing protein n=1 Tax=Paenibacillus sp. 32O-W TaxID=1695218 RepID=UPI0016435776|nr:MULTISPECIES: FRG domain-containing protein [Paenibacillaceae]